MKTGCTAPDAWEDAYHRIQLAVGIPSDDVLGTLVALPHSAEDMTVLATVVLARVECARGVLAAVRGERSMTVHWSRRRRKASILEKSVTGRDGVCVAVGIEHTPW